MMLCAIHDLRSLDVDEGNEYITYIDTRHGNSLKSSTRWHETRMHRSNKRECTHTLA